MGGLGNILFQINAAYNLMDKGFSFEYDSFLLNNNLLTRVLGWTIHGKGQLFNLLNIEQRTRFYSSVDVFMLWISKRLNKELFGRKFANFAIDVNDSTKVVSGYFQDKEPINQKFVDDIKVKFLKLYENSKFDPNEYDFVIHYRAADYIKYGIPLLKKNFYENIVSSDSSVLIVTNDTIAAKNLFGNEMQLSNLKIHSGSDACEDFVILMRAKKLIIANSTFSWWAAELSSAEKIYQPEPFFPNLNWMPKSLKRRIAVPSAF